MVLRGLSICGVLLIGCAPAVQRADVTPALVDVKAHAAELAAARPRKLVFRSPKARVKVFANDLLNGDHHLTFGSVRGNLLVDKASGRGLLHVDVSMRVVRAENDFITDFASRMLEVRAFPHALFDATLEPIDGEPNRRLVTGNMRLHGIERRIQFRADVADEGDATHFRAVFDMSRSAFGIHARAEEGEGIIRDDFTVTFDFRATPERVVVEEVTNVEDEEE
jgi:polyisoprenoid-binding protein YceI